MQKSILHVIKGYYPEVGGMETTARQLAEDSARRDYKVAVLCCGARDEITEFNGVTIYRFKPLFNVGSAPVSFRYMLKLWKLLGQFDIVNFHVPHPIGEMAFCLSRNKHRVKSLCTYQLDPVRPKMFVSVYKKLLRHFMRDCGVICPTSPNYILSSDVLRPFKGKCEVVPLSVDVESFANVSEERIREAEAMASHLPHPRVLFCGRFAYFKGIPYLLEAMSLLPECSLILVGDGKKRREAEEITDRLELRDRVVFAGLRTGELYRAFFHVADVFAFPSTWPESFGIVGLEAMAAGLPIVTTEIGAGSSYFNVDGETGFIVPPKNPQALADAIRKIISNPELAASMSRNARKRVEGFSVEKMLERYNEIYNEFSGGGTGRITL